MEHSTFSIAWTGQKTLEAPTAAWNLLHKPLSDSRERHGFHHQLHLPALPGLQNLGRVFELQIQGGDAGRGVPQGFKLRDSRAQHKQVVGLAHSLHNGRCFNHGVNGHGHPGHPDRHGHPGRCWRIQPAGFCGFLRVPRFSSSMKGRIRLFSLKPSNAAKRHH